MFPELIIKRELSNSDRRIQTDTLQKHSQKWFDDLGKAFAYGFSDGYDNFLYISDTALFQFVMNESHVTAYTFEQTKHELIYDTYYRIALPLILQARGKEVIHASAIISGDQITVFCANSGTGKSTLAYALYLRGYELGADDAVAIEIIRSKAIAVPLPFRIRLLADSKEYFSLLENVSADNLFESRRSFLVREKLPLKSICIVNKIHPSGKNDRRFYIKKTNPIDGFSLLLSHAYVFHLKNINTKRSMIENYLEIVNLVPIYRIDYPHNFEYLSDLLDQIEKII